MYKCIKDKMGYFTPLPPELEDSPIDTKLTFGRDGVPKPAKNGDYIIGAIADMDDMRGR